MGQTYTPGRANEEWTKNSTTSVVDYSSVNHHPSHLYYNWNGTIRIPSVLMYATTLAKHTGQDE